jgi:ABC-2 type transport system ATP-binding protein
MTQPAGADVAVAALGLAKRYDRHTLALAGLDLAIARGTITALVGPNGSGKSTFMKACVGFERPTRGRVEVAGVDPWRNRPAALGRLGYVPQVSALYRELTVAEHVDLARTVRPGYDAGTARRRLEELAIPHGTPTERLSGGQRAQVSLALVLGTHAEVLLLDEPLASLDPLARREFLWVLADAVRSDGSTAVLSSHVIADVEQACDQLVVLGAGRKILELPTATAVHEHHVLDGDGSGPVPPGAEVVAPFPGPAGERLRLVRITGDDGGGLAGPGGEGLRAATLEEVVIGYLAHARSLPAHGADA